MDASVVRASTDEISYTGSRIGLLEMGPPYYFAHAQADPEGN